MSGDLALEAFAQALPAFGRSAGFGEGRDHARLCLADALACASLGTGRPAHRASQSAMAGIFAGRDRATIWFGPAGRHDKHDAVGAAYLNSVAVSAEDLDDGHRLATGHPGGAVIPAVLAEAEAGGFLDADLLGAVVVGYEAGVAFAAGRDTGRVPTMATGRWGSVAAAAASCWLGGDDTATTASALAHAASMAPQLIAPDARRADGLKEGTPWSVVAGLVAVRLARAGIPAPTYLLERHPDFDQDRLDLIAPGPRPAILDTYFKRYGCCRWIHPVIDALITLNAAEPIDPASVLRVEIATFARSLTLSNLTSPTHLEEAHYSFPFCVAVAIVDGADALAPIDERLLGRPDLVALARRVGLTSHSTLERDFPAKTPAVVRVTTTAGVRELAVDTARGDPSLPFTSAVLRSKRHRLLSVQSPTAADAVEELVVGSPTVTLRRLLPILRPGTVAG